MKSQKLKAALDQYTHYLENNIDHCKNHPASRTSQFWKEHFEARLNFPTLIDFVSFRQSDYLYGIGETRQSNLKQKRLEFDQTLKSTSLSTPRTFLESLSEPVFGAPLLFTEQDICLSNSFLINAGTAWRILNLIQEFYPQDKPLNILEIGAGWGACAYILMQQANVNSYSIIDLPENLCLSSVYHSVTQEQKEIKFLECSPEQNYEELQVDTIQFGLPPAIDNISSSFDIIINTLSFQEMDKESVDEYLAFAQSRLVENGLVISFNAHQKAGIRFPREYYHNGFQLKHMQPFRKVPAGFFNTIPYEMVFQKQAYKPQEDEKLIIDVYGELMQLGLEERFLPAPHTKQEKLDELNLIYDFFNSANEADREKSIDQLMHSFMNMRTVFLAGNYAFLNNNFSEAEKQLNQAIELGLNGFALVRAHTMLALIKDNSSGSSENPLPNLKDENISAAGLSEEIAGYIDDKNFTGIQGHISRVLKIDSQHNDYGKRALGRIKRMFHTKA